MWSRARGLGFWLYVWLPVVAGMGIIVMESTPYLGADHTTGPFRWLYQALFGPVSVERWGQIHLVLRKSGHFLGYGLLGLLWLRAWWKTLPSSVFLMDAALALLGTGVTASADEFHQTFLPNRTGTPWDVLLDCSGALAMQLLVYVMMRIFRPKKLKRSG